MRGPRVLREARLDYRIYRRMGWSKYRCLILTFWDLPVIRDLP